MTGAIAAATHTLRPARPAPPRASATASAGSPEYSRTSAHQRIIHPAPNAIHGAEKLAVHSSRGVRDHAQMGPAEHVVVVLGLTWVRREAETFVLERHRGGTGRRPGTQVAHLRWAHGRPVLGVAEGRARLRRHLGGWPGPRPGAMRPAAEALAGIAEVRGLGPGPRAQI